MKRFPILWGLTGAVLLTLLLWAFPAVMQSTTPNKWTPPKFVDYGWWQYPAVDRQGNLHLIWYGSEQKLDELIYTRRNPDDTWTKTNDIFCACVQGFTVRSGITVTSDGEVRVVYRKQESHLFSSAYYSEAESANKWTPPIGLSTNSYYVTILGDRDDTLHVAYAQGVRNPAYRYFEDDPCPFCTDIFYRRSTDGGRTWSNPVDLSNSPDGSERMDFVQGPSGRIYLYWTEGFDGWHTTGQYKDVRFVYSDDQGVSWSEPIILDGGNKLDQRPTNLVLTELRDGRILAVWRYSGRNDWNFYYQLSSDIGKTWTDPRPIPGFLARDFNTNKYDNPALVLDKLGIAHFFAAGQAQPGESVGNVVLYHTEFAQNDWFGTEVVFQSFNETPEWPKAVIGEQNDIHLTWFTRVFNRNGDQLPQRGLKVYYSHLEGNLQDRPTEVFKPTLTPFPSPTPFQAFEPTPTPVPTLAAPAEPLYLATQDIYAIQTLLGGFGISLLFCIVVFVLLRLFNQSR